MTRRWDHLNAPDMLVDDLLARWHTLEGRHHGARSIAILKARGDFDPAGHGGENPPWGEPLSTAEYVEAVALGAAIAARVQHPATVDRAVRAGASWAEVAAALQQDEDQVREAYREWAAGQRHLRELYPEHEWGLSEAEYAAALVRADA